MISDLILTAEAAALKLGEWLLAPERRYGEVRRFSVQTETMYIDGRKDIEIEYNFHHNTMNICLSTADGVHYVNVLFHGDKGPTHHASAAELQRMGLMQ